jgi:miniconductance mechanosensitive channel
MIVLWIVGFIIISRLLLLVMLSFNDLWAVSLIICISRIILGFCCSVQVSVNDMIRIGDWITMAKFGADGDVIKSDLTTVKFKILTTPP